MSGMQSNGPGRKDVAVFLRSRRHAAPPRGPRPGHGVVCRWLRPSPSAVVGLWLKSLGSALIAAGIVRLFLVGHDACHGSFFAAKTLNHVFGRIAFLPSMTAFSLWDVGHKRRSPRLQTI